MNFRLLSMVLLAYSLMALTASCSRPASNQSADTFISAPGRFSIQLPSQPSETRPLIPEKLLDGFHGNEYRWKLDNVSFTITAVVDPSIDVSKTSDEDLRTYSGVTDLELNDNIKVTEAKAADFKGRRGFEYVFIHRDTELTGRSFLAGNNRYLLTAGYPTNDQLARDFAIRTLDTFTVRDDIH